MRWRTTAFSPRRSSFLSSDARSAARRGGLARKEAELAQEVHLVEEQVLGLQGVALGDIDGRPPDLWTWVGTPGTRRLPPQWSK